MKSRGWPTPSACGQSEPKQDALDRNVPGQVGDIVFDERRHPAIAVELIDRVLLEHAGVLRVDHLQVVKHGSDPSSAVLDEGETKLGETDKQPMRNQHGREIADQAMLLHHVDQL